MTSTQDIRDLLLKRSNDSNHYVVAEEVGNATGSLQRRRIDMIVVNCYPSEGLKIEGIEIKQSKEDLKTELEHPEKHTIFFDNLDLFSLACPAGIISLNQIPKKWGVYIVKDNKLKVLRRPIPLHGDEKVSKLDKEFVIALIRKIYQKRPELDYRYKIKQEVRESILEQFSNKQKYIQENYDKINKYDDLTHKLRLYHDGDEELLDTFLEEFSKFRTYMNDKEYMIRNINLMKNSIDKSLDSLIILVQNFEGVKDEG